MRRWARAADRIESSGQGTARSSATDRLGHRESRRVNPRPGSLARRGLGNRRLPWVSGLRRPDVPLSTAPFTGPSPGPGALPPLESALEAPDVDRLRRQAHDLIETFLAAFSSRGPTPYDRVPLLRAAAAVSAGGEARVVVKVANEEETPSSVSLYSTNLVADAGYDIPSVRVTCSPRSTTIAARGEASFEVKIAVPAQAPAGVYSGLVQATGTLYVKAVISVEVK